MKKLVFLTFLVVAFLPSCRERYIAEKKPIILSPSTRPVHLSKSAIMDGMLPLNRTIRASAYHIPAEAGSTPCDLFTDQEFTFSMIEGAWKGSQYWPTSGELTLLCCSSSDSNITPVWGYPEPTALVQFLIKDNSYVQDDLLVGCVEQVRRTSAIDIEFQHAYALLTFKAQTDKSFDIEKNSGVVINKIVMHDVVFGGKCRAERHGDRIVFSWTDLEKGQDREITGIQDVAIAEQVSPSLGVPLLVVPTPQTEMTLYYTLHQGFDSYGNPVNNPLVYNIHPGDSWIAGMSTNYVIDISLTAVSVTAKVAPWGEDNQRIEF